MSCSVRCLSVGDSASALLTALNILVLRSVAEALVKVTMSILEISAGESGSVIERIILSVRVEVLPEPAAALRRSVLFFVLIAVFCASVHCVAMPSSLKIVPSAHRLYRAVFARVVACVIDRLAVGNTLVDSLSDIGESIFNLSVKFIKFFA